MSRTLGIDFGERRIGLALSDPLGITAQPLPVVTRRRGKKPPYAELERVVAENEVTRIVVGLPLAPSGEDSEWTTEVRAFGKRLGERTGLPVDYVDERMTSARAERAVRSSGLRKSERERKDRIDTAAAILILQAYLDGTRT